MSSVLILVLWPFPLFQWHLPKTMAVFALFTGLTLAKTILETLSWKRKEIRALESFMISKFWPFLKFFFLMIWISYQRHFGLQTAKNLVGAERDKQTEFITGLEQPPLEPPGWVGFISLYSWGIKVCTAEILENRCWFSPFSVWSCRKES